MSKTPKQPTTPKQPIVSHVANLVPLRVVVKPKHWSEDLGGYAGGALKGQQPAAKPAPKHDYRLLFFTADWCGACPAAKAEVKKLAKSNPEITIEIVDLSDETLLPDGSMNKNNKLADTYKVNSIPWFVVVDEAQRVRADPAKMLPRVAKKLRSFGAAPASKIAGLWREITGGGK